MMALALMKARALRVFEAVHCHIYLCCLELCILMQCMMHALEVVHVRCLNLDHVFFRPVLKVVHLNARTVLFYADTCRHMPIVGTVPSMPTFWAVGFQRLCLASSLLTACVSGCASLGPVIDIALGKFHAFS
jgi:hypothetical protein